MFKLDASVRLVELQFSFSNPEAIPRGISYRETESYEERVARKSRASGTMIIEPTEKCSLTQFLSELEPSGYELVDMFYQERLDGKDPNGRRTYFMVRFVFLRREFANFAEEFKAVRDAERAALSEMCRTAMWRVRAYLNPFYKDGEEVAGEGAVSINLEARTPLFRPDGQPVMVWQKDEAGERVGDAPLPLKPNLHLRILDSVVAIATT